MTNLEMELFPPIIGTAYVYCDLVKHVAVWDTKAPLLRIVNIMSDRAVQIYMKLSIFHCTLRYRRDASTLSRKIWWQTPDCLFSFGSESHSLFLNFVELPINICDISNDRHLSFDASTWSTGSIAAMLVWTCTKSEYARQNGGEITVFAGRRF